MRLIFAIMLLLSACTNLAADDTVADPGMANTDSEDLSCARDRQCDYPGDCFAYLDRENDSHCDYGENI